MSEAPPVHLLYSRYLEDPENNRVAERLWGRIPGDMTEAAEQMHAAVREYGAAPERIEDLKKALKRSMRRLGILTERASANIDHLESGAAETGQQPNLLAGPSLILNKTVYTTALARLGGGVPVYFVGDYDGVQPELINGRVPSPGGRGMVFTYPVPHGYEGAPIRNLPNPPEEWLRKTLEKLDGNTRGLLKDVDPGKQERTLRNLEHAETIIRSAYHSTGNVSDWSSRILGTLLNIESDLGVVFFTPSDPEVRRLLQPGFERLLSEPSRSRFVAATNGAVDLIESSGYRAQIGRRGDGYVPFFLECPTEDCHGNRVELSYGRREGSGEAALSGKCPVCGSEYDYTVSAEHPDISDIIDLVSPRVDSRQVAVNAVLPVAAHVGGPGETSYHAEVMPGVRAMGLPFPAYVRYTRVFYNTPWNEGYAEALKRRGLPSLMEDRLFRGLAAWVESNKSNEKEGILSAHTEISRAIDDTYNRLLSRESELQHEIDGIKKRLGDPETRKTLFPEMRAKQAEAGEIDAYLSSAFGRFSPEKYGQEVGWLWVDLAASSGMRDLTSVYERLYGPWTPNSAVYFVNLG